MAVFVKRKSLKKVHEEEAKKQEQKDELREVEDACLDLASLIQAQQTGIEELQDALIEIAGMVANATESEG